jgi:hypothetical protein
MNTTLQISYAEPIEYNVENYSTPADDLVFFHLKKDSEGKFSYSG